MKKFDDQKLKDKRAVNNLIWQMPLFDNMKDDVPEP